MSESRRQRRNLAKKLGYLGKDETLDQQRERFRRSQEMGKYLHLSHLERLKNLELEIERDKTQEEENNLVSNLTNSNEYLESSAFNFLSPTHLENNDLPQGSDSIQASDFKGTAD